MIINGNEATVVPSIINIGFKGVESEPMVILMNHKGVCLSMGAACNSESIEPSYVLQAMKVPKAYIRGCLRLSFCYSNTLDEVDQAMNLLKNIINKLRNYDNG